MHGVGHYQLDMLKRLQNVSPLMCISPHLFASPRLSYFLFELHVSARSVIFLICLSLLSGACLLKVVLKFIVLVEMIFKESFMAASDYDNVLDSLILRLHAGWLACYRLVTFHWVQIL